MLILYAGAEAKRRLTKRDETRRTDNLRKRASGLSPDSNPLVRAQAQAPRLSLLLTAHSKLKAVAISPHRLSLLPFTARDPDHDAPSSRDGRIHLSST